MVFKPAATLLGVGILQFFGVSLASFQGGGGLLLSSSLSMLNAQTPATRSTDDELHDAQERVWQGASVAMALLG